LNVCGAGHIYSPENGYGFNAELASAKTIQRPKLADDPQASAERAYMRRFASGALSVSSPSGWEFRRGLSTAPWPTSATSLRPVWRSTSSGSGRRARWVFSVRLRTKKRSPAV
jgi:hypothetical protein